MLKKVLSLVIVGTMFFSIYACSSPEADNKENIASDGISGIRPPKGCEIVYDIEKFEKVTGDQTYNENTDANTSFDVQFGGTDTGDILYLNSGKNWIIYCDKNTGNSDLLCGKPECDHWNDECNAYVAGSRGVQYYNGYLYTVVYDDRYRLEKISVDGAQREDLGSMLGVDNVLQGEGSSTIRWIIHRGYIYYIYHWGSVSSKDVYYLNNSNCIYRKKLEKDSKPECIMALPVLSQIEYVKFVGAGSYIYMIIPNADETSSSLYRYNTESEKLEYFKQWGSEISAVAVQNNKIYYSENNMSEHKSIIYCYDMEKNEKSIFIEINGIIGTMPYDDDYMYIAYEDEDMIWKMGAWDWSGRYISQIPADNEFDVNEGKYRSLAGSDDENIYIWCMVSNSEKENIYNISNAGAYTIMEYIDKEDISDGEYEIKDWSEIAGKSE